MPGMDSHWHEPGRVSYRVNHAQNIFLPQCGQKWQGSWVLRRDFRPVALLQTSYGLLHPMRLGFEFLHVGGAILGDLVRRADGAADLSDPSRLRARGVGDFGDEFICWPCDEGSLASSELARRERLGRRKKTSGVGWRAGDSNAATWRRLRGAVSAHQS